MARVVRDELRATIDSPGFIKSLASKVGAVREWTRELHAEANIPVGDDLGVLESIANFVHGDVVTFDSLQVRGLTRDAFGISRRSVSEGSPCQWI